MTVSLATVIRTVVVVFMACGMVFMTHTQNGIVEISRKSWFFFDFVIFVISGLR